MKKSVKRLMSAFMALAMVLSLGMSLGGVTASATEIEEVYVDEAMTENDAVALHAAASGEVYSDPDGWYFTHQRDTDTFSANAGQSVSFVITGVQSDSSSRFTVSLCRYVVNSNGQKVAQIVSGPITQESNQNYAGTTITFQATVTDNDYFIRCLRDSEVPGQNFASVTVYVGG